MSSSEEMRKLINIVEGPIRHNSPELDDFYDKDEPFDTENNIEKKKADIETEKGEKEAGGKAPYVVVISVDGIDYDYDDETGESFVDGYSHINDAYAINIPDIQTAKRLEAEAKEKLDKGEFSKRYAEEDDKHIFITTAEKFKKMCYDDEGVYASHIRNAIDCSTEQTESASCGASSAGSMATGAMEVDEAQSRHLTCSNCASDAGKWKQWPNQDTGFGVCPDCAEKHAVGKWKHPRDPMGNLVFLYGRPNVHFDASKLTPEVINAANNASLGDFMKAEYGNN